MLSRGTTPHVTLSPRFNAADDVEEISASMEAVSSRRDQPWLKRACLARDGGKCVITGAYDPRAYLRLASHRRILQLDCDTEAAHIVPFALGSSVIILQSLKNKEFLLINYWLVEPSESHLGHSISMFSKNPLHPVVWARKDQ